MEGQLYFLLVLNKNFGSLSHRFWDTASFRFKNAYFYARELASYSAH